jgi:hypothetical protein
VSDISAGIFAATELYKIVKEFGRVEREFGKVEIKEHLVDVLGKLVDLKQSLVDAQEREFALQKLIAELEAKLADRGRFRDLNGFLFQIDENGNGVGEPYCNHCYVKEDKLFRLIQLPNAHKCNNCENIFKAPRNMPSELKIGGSIFDN